MMPFIHIGGLTIPTYGACLATAALVAYFLLRAQFTRARCALPAGPLVIGTVAVGVAGASLHARIASSLTGSSGGLTYYGAFIVVLLALPVLARLYRVGVLALGDMVTPAAALAYGVGRLGCFFSGDGDYGVPTSLPWGMTFPHGVVPTNVPVHPTPLYELGTSLVITVWLVILSRRPQSRDPGRGIVSGHYLVWTGLARFAVEFIKRNPPVLGGLAEAQWIALASIAFGLLLCARVAHRRAPLRAETLPMRPI